MNNIIEQCILICLIFTYFINNLNISHLGMQKIRIPTIITISLNFRFRVER